MVKLYFAGHDTAKNPIRAAALLSVQPTSEAQQLTLASISRDFDSAMREKVRELIESLRKTQASIVERGSGEVIEELKGKQ